MEFNVTKQTLEPILFAAYRAVNTSSPMAALTGILLSLKGGKLTATGTDLEIAVSASVDVEAIDEGTALLPASHFYELVKRLPDGPLSFSIESTAVIRHSSRKWEVTTLPVDEYPDIPNVEGGKVTVKTVEFLNALRKVKDVCINDPARPVFGGVYFNITPFGLEMVATDTHRINWTYVPASGDDAQAIVPGKVLGEIMRVVKSDQTDIIIGSNLAKFISGDMVVVSRLISGKYPDAVGMVPTSFDGKTKINVSELIDTLNRVSLLTSKENNRSTAKLNITGGTFVVDATNEVGSLHEKLKCTHEGKPVEMNFNVEYLIEPLRFCSEPTLCFVSTGRTPCLKIDDNGFYSMVLPIIEKKKAKDDAA
ncbi:MAG: DNA polymerase III subunit beta [Peptococcaceae bacterium]|nr:DNA polymerase III subunit beta [Peptococcaceae bacterium]